ncbi:MAG: extracellular solute-binding protein [Coriobacteriia bacterium]|nr:extracellular solute-binding protein [Coriobacteriia bacterium]
MKKRFLSLCAVVALAGLMMALAACGSAGENAVPDAPEEAVTAPADTVNMVLASTTSTQDSGLFDALIPAFNEAHPEINVQVVAVGSGEAMEMGRRGDADVLLVHSPAAEITFMDEGYGTERLPVMYNDLVIVGPEADPADVAGAADANEAFKRIADSQSTFISRGDDSGTHARELSIWALDEITPADIGDGSWYEESGQGMGATLKIAEEFQAYTLTDRATYLNLTKEGALQLPILNEGSTELLNYYHVITVKDAKEQAAAQAFMDWIVSPAGQETIATFGLEDFGAALFTPNADAQQ